jgi:hypothetical protein
MKRSRFTEEAGHCVWGGASARVRVDRHAMGERRLQGAATGEVRRPSAHDPCGTVAAAFTHAPTGARDARQIQWGAALLVLM